MPSFSDDPYRPPNTIGPHSFFPDAAELHRAKTKLMPPAISLLVLAPFGLALMLFDFGARMVNISNGDLDPLGLAKGQNREALLMGAYLGAGIDIVAAVAQIVVVIGALNMLRVRSYGLAMTAAVVSLIPCLTSCCVIGIPFGIWAMIVLNDPVVKSAFK